MKYILATIFVKLLQGYFYINSVLVSGILNKDIILLNIYLEKTISLASLGVKMKNPETEAIPGFCCNLLFNSAEREGLFAKLMIPGGGLQSLNYPSGINILFLCFLIS